LSEPDECEPWRPGETLVERRIRQAQERGEFDDLPGKGKPLPGLSEPDDELWWVRRFVRREGVPADALLPPGLALRKEIERLPETLRVLPDEESVRELAAELNRRVVEQLRVPSGPVVPLRRVNPDELVRTWREVSPRGRRR
jgi:hypothetical protein